VTEDVRVRTSGFFEGIREDGKPPVVQRALPQVLLVARGLDEALACMEDPA
jgi:hypothetical protein